MNGMPPLFVENQEGAKLIILTMIALEAWSSSYKLPSRHLFLTIGYILNFL